MRGGGEDSDGGREEMEIKNYRLDSNALTLELAL